MEEGCPDLGQSVPLRRKDVGQGVWGPRSGLWVAGLTLGLGPHPEPGLGTLVQIRGWGPSSRSGAGDPRPWAVGPSCQDDPLRDPASLSAQ